MKSKTAFVLFIVGLLMTFGAVGGMEDPALVDRLSEQIIMVIVGLGLMLCGALGLQASEYYD